MPPRLKITSFENASLLRKLTILYFLMSIVPVSVLYYLYVQLRNTGAISISEKDLSGTLIFVVIGVGVGYVAMRSTITKIMEITRKNRDTLQDIFGPQMIDSLTGDSNNEIAILAKSFNEVTSRLEENIRNLELAKKTLHSVLSKVGEGISSMDNIDNFLNLIVQTVTEALQSETGVLFLTDPKREDLVVKTVFGRDSDRIKQLRLNPKNNPFSVIFETKQPAVFEKLPKEGGLSSVLLAPLLCAPLALRDEVSGLIVVCGRRADAKYDNEEKNLLQNLALQTAVAIENSRLNEDAERTYFETITALALAVEARDLYSRGHSDRVSHYVAEIGQELNLNPEDIDTLRDAAKLHDLGKIGVTDEVLKKDGPLTASERERMKKHCEIGEGIIKPIRSFRELADVVRHHHEKLDGSGYPDGLKGDEIHLLVRILAVADIYDALTTNRPYRAPFAPAKAVEELRNMKDQLDQKVVDAIARVVL